MSKSRIAIAAICLIAIVAISSIGNVAAYDVHKQNKQDDRPHLAYFYNATNGHLIQNPSNVDDMRMLWVVKLLDLKYNVTYYDLGKYPGYTSMARFGYGVTSTPTLSILGPDFPHVASQFHNIVGYHNAGYCERGIKQTEF